MSSTLTWKPVKSKGSLPDELKWALEKGDLFNGVEGIYGENCLSYLRGLRDGGVKGADKLIKLIEKYGEVELDLEY